MLVQAAFLREILAVFRGGELTMGIALLSWLLWTAAGSGLSGKLVNRMKQPETWLFLLLPLYGIFGYLGTVLTGNAPFLFRLTPGELASYDLQFVAVVFFLLPFNVLGGFLFALGARALERPGLPSAGRAFTIEAFGAATGGILFSLVLVPRFSNHTLALACPIIATVSTAVWALRPGRPSPFDSLSRRAGEGSGPTRIDVPPLRPGRKGGQEGGKIGSGTFSRLHGIFLVIPLPFLAGAIFVHSLAADYPYRGQQLLEQRETRYSRLRITRSGEQVTLYSGASVLFTAPNPETSEHAVHFPMMAARNPKKVLVLGGGPVGEIGEVLKYGPVERVTAVDLDPEVFTLASSHLDWPGKGDKRVELVAADGRAFLERTGERFDVITMNAPAPLSGQANRYYTREFFRLVAERLSPEGVFGFPLAGAENYIPEDLARFLASIRTSLGAVFPSVFLIPGMDIRFLASPAPGRFDALTWESLERDRTERGVETAYFRDYFLQFTMAPERVALLRESLDTVRNPVVNSDLKPSGYFLRTIVQGNLDGSRLIRGMDALAHPGILTGILAALGLLLLAPGLFPGGGARDRAVASTVLTVGLTEISLEILALMAYQSFFGFLYSRVALLTGAYMAGLALGGLRGARLAEQGKADTTRLARIQAGIALTAFAWIPFLRAGDVAGSLQGIMEAGFFFLTALAGFLGGMQFPLADVLFRKGKKTDPGGGRIYGFDLAGSAAGAFITASLVIPSLGMVPALALLGGINLAVAGVMALRAR
jgi:spermidine synthase